MTKKTESAVTETKDTAVAGVTQDLGAWGENQMDSRDIVLPKILCMQGLSVLVADDKAKMGDFVDSLSNEVIGSINEPVKFIPFHMEKIYIISKKESGANRYDFDRIEPVTNQDYPFTNVIDGTEFKYEYTLQFYCLRPEDTSLPYVLSFKSTSLKTGKVLSTQMYVRNRAAGLVPPAYVMELSGRKEKNDQGTFVVMEVKAGAKSTADQVNECLNWYKTVQSGATKVSHEEATNHPETSSKF